MIDLKLLPPKALDLAASKAKQLRSPHKEGISRNYLMIRLLKLEGGALLALADALNELGFDPDSEFTRCGLWQSREKQSHKQY